jgi:hypothetical protein
MGSWHPGQGRLLLLDPDAAEGKRISVLIGKPNFPFGLSLRTDTAGNLHVARMLKGTIAVLTSAGKLTREIEREGADQPRLRRQ